MPRRGVCYSIISTQAYIGRYTGVVIVDGNPFHHFTKYRDQNLREEELLIPYDHIHYEIEGTVVEETQCQPEDTEQSALLRLIAALDREREAEEAHRSRSHRPNRSNRSHRSHRPQRPQRPQRPPARRRRTVSSRRRT